MAKIIVQDTEITVSNVNGEDYICITDMLKAKDGDFFVTDWLLNRNTTEFLDVWEHVYNPNFKYGEFATIRNAAGSNSFVLSLKYGEYQRRAHQRWYASGRTPSEAQQDCHPADAGAGRQ